MNSASAEAKIKRIKQVVYAALKRNTFTAQQAIEVHLKGRVVVLTGQVTSEELIYEAVATVESVSPLLRVISRLEVAAWQPESASQPALVK